MKLSDLKPGANIVADAGFTCMGAGAKVVKGDARGLYIECDEGRHYLVGQLGENGELIGLSAAEAGHN